MMELPGEITAVLYQFYLVNRKLVTHKTEITTELKI